MSSSVDMTGSLFQTQGFLVCALLVAKQGKESKFLFTTCIQVRKFIPEMHHTSNVVFHVGRKLLFRSHNKILPKGYGEFVSPEASSMDILVLVNHFPKTRGLTNAVTLA